MAVSKASTAVAPQPLLYDVLGCCLSEKSLETAPDLPRVLESVSHRLELVIGEGELVVAVPPDLKGLGNRRSTGCVHIVPSLDGVVGVRPCWCPTDELRRRREGEACKSKQRYGPHIESYARMNDGGWLKQGDFFSWIFTTASDSGLLPIAWFRSTTKQISMLRRS